MPGRPLSWLSMEPSPITFARGAPSLDIVPVADLRTAAQDAFERDPKGAFSYGTAGGYGPLRDWIAERHGADREQVLATNGSMQADAFLFQLKVQRGDTVVVEAPTYDRTMLSLDTENRVVYASSFSKTVCPGIRVGYLVGPKATIAAVEQRATATYISPNMVAQAIVSEFCRSGALDRSIEAVKVALHERR